MIYGAKQYNMETAINWPFADYKVLSSYKWEVGQDSWRSDHFPINIILNRRADFRILHCATPYLHREDRLGTLYLGESNENRKTEIKIRNIAPLSYKLADMLPML
jgi:hypothetical protein